MVGKLADELRHRPYGLPTDAELALRRVDLLRENPGRTVLRAV